MSEIKRIKDGRETQKNQKEQENKETNKQTNKQRQKRTTGDRSYSERVRAKWFCCAFKLGFLQLIHKASLIFKPNYCKTKRIIWVKTCCPGV